ncbi:MAG: tetratricopeptide repeat protein [Phycisphaerae bacterium]
MSAYTNSFSGVFLFDDYGRIVGNKAIEHVLPISTHLAAARPLVSLSLAVNYAIGGLNPTGYHVFNLAIHLLAGLTLYGILRRTLRLGRFEHGLAAAADRVAFAASLLWLVHPLHTQSVTYVIQRAESMMGLCYLLTLYCFIRTATAGRSRSVWGLGAVFACACGMACKPVMVTAPVVVWLYDRVFLRRSPRASGRGRVAVLLGLAACWIIPFSHGVGRGLVRSATIDNAGSTATVGFAVPGITPIEYALTQAQVIPRYLRLSLWPAGQTIDYGWPIVRSWREAALPGMIVLGLLAATGWALWKQPAIGFLGVWFFAILAPTSSFIPIKDPIYEHRMYLSLAAVAVLVVVSGRRLSTALARRLALPAGRRTLLATGALAVAAGVLGTATYRRNNLYHSRLAMWADVLRKRPENARAHSNYGLILFNEGKVEEAVEHYRRALELNPNLRQARDNLRGVKDRYYNRGLESRQAGRTAEALDWYRQARRIAPEDLRIRINLANCLVDLGRTAEAITELQGGLASAEANAPPLLRARAGYNLGNTLVRINRIDEAIEAYRAAVRADPTYANAYYGLGWALEAEGRPDEAITAYRRALSIQPGHAEARQALDAAAARRGQHRP